jgi:ABC-2 type transport system ATP-binding protein
MNESSQHDPAVLFANVTRRFGATKALDDVSLALPNATIIGLIGRNGSGKSTLLQHITGLLLPDSGECRTLGVKTPDLGADQLTRIGAVAQHSRLIEWMSVARFIRYIAAYFPRWDVALERDLLTRLELSVDARVGALTPGVRQRLQLLLSLCHRPELLLLDEPLSDLDPTSRAAVLEVLLDMYEQYRPTMVISSHLLHDIEPVVTRVVCLVRGRVTANDELDALKERYGVNLEQLFPLLTADNTSERAMAI